MSVSWRLDALRSVEIGPGKQVLVYAMSDALGNEAGLEVVVEGKEITSASLRYKKRTFRFFGPAADEIFRFVEFVLLGTRYAWGEGSAAKAEAAEAGAQS